MSNSPNDEMGRHGYVSIKTLDPTASTEAVARSLGVPLEPWEGRLVQELTPKASSTPNTYSGLYGTGAFPFHTDLAHWRHPPRYLLLRCLNGYADVPTPLLDGKRLLEAVTPDVLSRAIYKPRRPQRGVVPLLRLFETIEDNYRLRWDEIFIGPASRVGQLADELVRNWVSKSQPSLVALSQRGDTLLIDNWRMLHARAPTATLHSDRKIERVYLGSLH